MPKPIKFEYEKKAPYRNAYYFIVVCEGQNREPNYFNFFDGISSRIKIVAVQSEGASAPNRLIEKAFAIESKLGTNNEIDKVWFVLDTDRWKEQLHTIREECTRHLNWKVAQSNPCFEVWLYFHAKAQAPSLDNIDQCNNWKPHLPVIIKGGFNTDTHPIAIETAISNSKFLYQSEGYFPSPGSTQLWQLGEELLPLIKKDLDKIKDRFPLPELLEGN